MYEVKSVMQHSFYANQDLWESQRLIAYILAQSNSKKKLKITDIIEFPWEKPNNDLPTSVSNEDLKRLEETANKFNIK